MNTEHERTVIPGADLELARFQLHGLTYIIEPPAKMKKGRDYRIVLDYDNLEATILEVPRA